MGDIERQQFWGWEESSEKRDSAAELNPHIFLLPLLNMLQSRGGSMTKARGTCPWGGSTRNRHQRLQGGEDAKFGEFIDPCPSLDCVPARGGIPQVLTQSFLLSLIQYFQVEAAPSPLRSHDLTRSWICPTVLDFFFLFLWPWNLIPSVLTFLRSFEPLFFCNSRQRLSQKSRMRRNNTIVQVAASCLWEPSNEEVRQTSSLTL